MDSFGISGDNQVSVRQSIQQSRVPRWNEIRALSSLILLSSDSLPRATLTVEPESPLFTGESVTLKCDIQSYSNWRYQWYKGSSGTAVSQSQIHTFTIRSAADQDQYWFRGERDNRPTSSQDSNRVSLSVGSYSKSTNYNSKKGDRYKQKAAIFHMYDDKQHPKQVM
ncbi:hypothetical protein NFI96_005864 [Prochilodus magdalenae]|nr:hypothetical protein NFI96_005864 [Prochilodus magdalenae]